MITYLKGDATNPYDLHEGKPMIIPHVCNNVGAWGAGFVIAVSKRWSEPENIYRTIANESILELGSTMFVQVERNIMVANMIAQNNVISKTGRNNPPIDYDALKLTLKTVYDKAKLMQASIHMPKIGSGLAGGNWDKIEKIINLIFVDVRVYVYIFN